jgi:hypothetical protein
LVSNTDYNEGIAGGYFWVRRDKSNIGMRNKTKMGTKKQQQENYFSIVAQYIRKAIYQQNIISQEEPS